MLPVEILNLLRGQALQRLIDINQIATTIIALHPEVGQEGEDQDRGGGSKVDAVTDREVGAVVAGIAPR